jgi:hypothetical protein
LEITSRTESSHYKIPGSDREVGSFVACAARLAKRLRLLYRLRRPELTRKRPDGETPEAHGNNDRVCIGGICSNTVMRGIGKRPLAPSGIHRLFQTSRTMGSLALIQCEMDLGPMLAGRAPLPAEKGSMTDAFHFRNRAKPDSHQRRPAGITNNRRHYQQPSPME